MQKKNAEKNCYDEKKWNHLGVKMPKSDLSAMMIGGSKIWTHNLRTAVQNNCLEFTNGDIFHPLPCQGRHNILCLFASTLCTRHWFLFVLMYRYSLQLI